MAHCCVPNCNSNSRKNPTVSFHEIPSEFEVRTAWLRMIGRKNWTPITTSNCSKVCSKHFRDTDFREGKRRLLKKGVVPSVFEDRPSCLQGRKEKGTACSGDDDREDCPPRKVRKLSSTPGEEVGDEDVSDTAEWTASDFAPRRSWSPWNGEEGVTPENQASQVCGTEMVNCCVPMCKSSSKSRTGVAFHEFPVTKVRNDWLKNISRRAKGSGSEQWAPNDRSKVCSLHFTREDYKEGLKMRRLKPDAVPTVFPNCPPYQRPGAKRKERRTLKRAAPTFADDSPAEDSAAEDCAADDFPADDSSVDYSPADDSPADDSSGGYSPVGDSPELVQKHRVQTLCVVPKCGSMVGLTPGVIFHDIPSNVQRRRTWLNALRCAGGENESWEPSEHAKVCSRHFTPGDYIQGPKKCYLAPHAVPSKFPGIGAKPPTKATTRPTISTLSKASESRPRDLRDVPSSSGRFQVKTTDRSCQTDQKPVELLATSPSSNESVQVSLDQSQPAPLSRGSVACQTHVTGLTIGAYQDQLVSLQEHCRKLQAELIDLRHRNAVLTAAAASSCAVHAVKK